MKNKHKHRFQFVKLLATYSIINDKAQFICDCGKTKIVNIK